MNAPANNKQLALKAMITCLSYVNHELISMGMKLALEDELSDLKGLVCPFSDTGGEYELLDILDDAVIQLVLKSIDRCNNLLKLLCRQNELKHRVVFSDNEVQEFASELFNQIIYEPNGTNRVDYLVDLDLVVCQTILLLYMLCRSYNGENVALYTDDQYWDLQLDFYRLDCIKFNEFDGGDENLTEVFNCMSDLKVIRRKINEFLE